jgi:hypothetical protein
MGIYLSPLSYGYWARESTWGNTAVGMPVTATAVHQGFNAMKSYPWPKDLKYEEEEVYLSNSIDAPGIIYTKLLKTAELKFEAFFRDPFLMLTMFNVKTISAAAQWNSPNYGAIAANFSGGVSTYKDSIMYQLHIDDYTGSPVSDIDRTFLGGKIVNYKIRNEAGLLLKEIFTVKFMNYKDQVRAFTSVANFDDGAFGDWDQDGPFHSTAVTVEWNGLAVVGIKSWMEELEIAFKEDSKHFSNSRVAALNWDGKREYYCRLEGILTTKAQLEQLESLHSAKTKQTLEYIYNDAAGNEERKWQFTNAFIKEFEIEGIPEAGNPAKCNITLKGGVGSKLTYAGAWHGLDHLDPYTSPKRVNTANR